MCVYLCVKKTAYFIFTLPMFRNLNLYIDTGKRPVEIPVHIEKITDMKTGLQTVYEGRKVRQVAVLIKDDMESAKSIDDIETVVCRTETQSGLVVKLPDGTTKVMSLDKETFKSEFSQTRNLRVISSIPHSSVNPYMFDGTHYELHIHGVTKKRVKIVDPAHQQLYNILLHGMSRRNVVFIAKYMSFGREKFCAIYPTTSYISSSSVQRTLLMSNLIHSNYFRPLTNVFVKREDEIESSVCKGIPKDVLGDGGSALVYLFDKINQTVPATLEPSDFEDRYERLLKQHVSRMIERATKSAEGAGGGAADGEDHCSDDDMIIEDDSGAIERLPAHLQQLLDL